MREELPPVPLEMPRPTYPRAARQRGMQGVVVLSIDVTPDGIPLSITVSTGSGYPMLDDAAVQAVGRWRFKPARKGGEAIAGQVVLPIRFNLAEG